MHSHDPEESLLASETFVVKFPITSSRLAFEWRMKKKKVGSASWMSMRFRKRVYALKMEFLLQITRLFDFGHRRMRPAEPSWIASLIVTKTSRDQTSKVKKKFSKFKAHRNFFDFVRTTRASYGCFDYLQSLYDTLQLSILAFDNRRMTLSGEISRLNSARFLRFLEVFRFYFLGSEQRLRHVAMKTRFCDSASLELVSLTTTTCRRLYSLPLLTFFHWLHCRSSFQKFLMYRLESIGKKRKSVEDITNLPQKPTKMAGTPSKTPITVLQEIAQKKVK